MIHLEHCFSGIPEDLQRRLQERLRPFADQRGTVPEPGEAAEAFEFSSRPADWEEFVAAARAALTEAYWSWRNETTGPPARMGFFLTATWECAIGKHESCKGWGHDGNFELTLRSSEGVRIPTRAHCACRGCLRHGASEDVASAGAGRVSESGDRPNGSS